MPSPSSAQRVSGRRSRGCPRGRSPDGSGMPLMPLATAAPETAVRQVAQVAVDARVGSHSGLFDYAVPTELTGVIEVGHRVRVPFGKRSGTGFVYALDQAPAGVVLKPIEALIDAEPVLPAVLAERGGL